MSDLDTRNWEAVKATLEIYRQDMVTLEQQIKATQGRLATLEGMFNQFNEQRIKELQLKVGNGPTER